MQKNHSYRNCQIIKCSQIEECAYFGFQSQNVCTKSLLRIHFLQHYYRNASTERTPQNNIHYHIFCFVHQWLYILFGLPMRPAHSSNPTKCVLELTLIDAPIDLNCLYNKFPWAPQGVDWGASCWYCRQSWINSSPRCWGVFLSRLTARTITPCTFPSGRSC